MRVCLCTCACVHASVSVCVCILRVCLCRGPPMWLRVCSACKLKTVRNVCGRKANPLALLTAKHSGKRGRKERQSPVSPGASLVPAQGPLAWVLRGSGFLFLPPASHTMFAPPPSAHLSVLRRLRPSVCPDGHAAGHPCCRVVARPAPFTLFLPQPSAFRRSSRGSFPFASPPGQGPP